MRLVPLAAAVALALAAPAYAAAPRYVLVSGPGLAKPVLLDDWWDNLRWLSATVNQPRVRAPERHARRYDLAMFWGVPEKPVPTRPRDANQHGWFFPATAARPAVVDLQVDGVRTPRRAPPALLRTLRAHGVPTRV